MKTFKKSLILCVAICALCTNWTAFALDKGFVYMQQYNIEGKPNGFELLEEERWFDIPGYEGLYQASTWSRIKSYPKYSDMPRGGRQYYESKILKQTTSDIYLTVTLFKNRQKEKLLVHRIIGKMFIPNPENKPEINHIDTIKTNNWPSNLEWNTRSENANHAYKNGLMLGAFKGISVTNTETSETFENTAAAAKSIGMPRKTLNNMLLGIVKNKTNFKRT